MGQVIGIDLGTSNSCVSIIEAGSPMVVVNAEGHRVTPSMVAFTTKGDRHVGVHAKHQSAVNPERTIFGIKRLLGHRFSDASVQELLPYLSFKVVEHRSGDAWVEVGDQRYSPQEISAMIVAKLKESVEAYTGEVVDQCVVAVPAYFNDAQRQATRTSCELAGLKVLRIMNEPTLAALAYGFKKRESGNVVVFDLGGGTFDVSVLACQEGTFQVLATAGINHLGGNDFDNVIFEHLCEIFKSESGLDVRSDKMAVQRIREASESVKCELSTMRESSVNLPFLAIGPLGPVHMMTTLTRSELEALIAPLLAALEAPCQDALKQAGLTARDVDEVLLIGGMTRMPSVQDRVTEIFGKQPSLRINPDEAVALGAAVQSGILGGEIQEVVLLDVTPLNLGIETAGDRVSTIIERNTTIPTQASKIFTTTEDNQNFVRIVVTQGDAARASLCTRLGAFILSDIPPMPAGKARIEVQFSIDSDGVVSVQGIDRQSGLVRSITIQNAIGLSQSELREANLRLQNYVNI